MKVADLTDAALDWAVAKCAGIPLLDPRDNRWELCWNLLGDDSGDYYSPSSDWEQGGCIIAREGINTFIVDDSGPFIWRAEKADPFGALRRKDISLQSHIGPTPLVAAMRCYVASKLGNEIEIPKGIF